MKTVILAGGKGTRLKPYTKIIPKPLMPLGETTILEVIIRQLTSQYFRELIITVGYLGELIKAFLGDGRRFNVNIKYSIEDEPLGTVGCLGLIQDDLKQTFLTVNGDILTTLNFLEVVNYHKRRGAIATIALNKIKTCTEYGITEIDSNDNIQKYIEKPILEHLVSMGIYVFEPKVIEYIQLGKLRDIPDLIKILIDEGETVKGFLFDGYWMDIGIADHYKKAFNDYEKMKQVLFPLEDRR